MATTVTTANDYVKRNGIDHRDSISFKTAINPGTKEDFKKEMVIFYPDKDGHFKGLNS